MATWISFMVWQKQYNQDEYFAKNHIFISNPANNHTTGFSPTNGLIFDEVHMGGEKSKDKKRGDEGAQELWGDGSPRHC